MANITWKILVALVAAGGIALMAGNGIGSAKPHSQTRPGKPVKVIVTKAIEPDAPDHKAPQDRLAILLEEWKQADREVKDIRKVMRRTRSEPILGQKTISSLTIMGSKPNLIRLEVKDAKNQPETTLVYRQGKWHVFDYKTQTELMYVFPGDTLTALLKEDSWAGSFARMVQLRTQWIGLGFDVDELSKSYHLRLLKEDEHYAYITACPCLPKAHDVFNNLVEIRIALGESSLQPRQITLVEPNGTTTVWDIQTVETNLITPVTTEIIQANLPKGWKKQDMPLPSEIRWP